jgi:outer membrane receptor protein involved in Fe transport
MGRKKLSFCLLQFVIYVVSSPVNASEFDAITSGEITGTVKNKTNITNLLEAVNITFANQDWGTATLDDGTFSISNIPTGAYTLVFDHIGFDVKEVTNVVVSAGERTVINVLLNENIVIVLDPLKVAPPPAMINDTTSGTIRTITEDFINYSTADEIEEIISLQAGVIAHGGEIHIRGARGGEEQYQVDGIPVKDPLGGGGLSLATLAVADSDVILGGLDAKYGNAQSGVILYQTKEGGSEFRGELRFQTDDYGQPNNTFDNFDRLFLGFGGPTAIDRLTYYVSGQVSVADIYPMTQEGRSRQKILNFISVGDRKNNSVKLQGKVAYQPSPNHKITFEMLDQVDRSDAYMHNWSRVGYVQQFLDTTRTNEVVLRYGRWSPVQLDSTYHYFNGAEHRPNVLSEFQNYKIVFRHSVNENALYSLKLSQQHYYNDVRVQGKNEWEYLGERERDYYFNYTDGRSEDFYVISGDYPSLSTQETFVSQALFDMTVKSGRHTIESGVSAVYNDMRNYSVDRPYVSDSEGLIGSPRSQYHYYNPEGAAYLQDRWEHEGMVINAGVRYDVFSVGQQVSLSNTQEPVKQQLSPRIGLTYPISDRDVFSFHYGRFYQIPDRFYLFDDLDAMDGRTQGNPNLTNETTVAYQAAIQHLFSEILVAQLSVYYRDMYGQVTSEMTADWTSTGNVRTYVNKDYASSKGFELSLNRNYGNNIRWDAAYSYGNATGVASDPDAATNRNFVYLPTGEQPLDWDSRHSLSTSLYLGDRINWGVSMTWRFASGTPYTPEQRDTRQLDPNQINSRRLGTTTTLDVRADKYYMLWGRRLSLFLQGRNILDAKNITSLRPNNNPAPPVGTAYMAYYTETGRAGGAYLDDEDGDGVEEYVPLHDPRVFGTPRSIRIGVGYQF